MREETGRVMRVDEQGVWVTVLRKSTCSACTNQAGCGQGVMERLGIGQSSSPIHAVTELTLSVGDKVVIGIPEETLVQSAVLVYLLPLLALLAAAGLATQWQWSEPAVIALSLGCLVLCAVVVRVGVARYANKPHQKPVVLRAELSAATLPAETF